MNYKDVIYSDLNSYIQSSIQYLNDRLEEEENEAFDNALETFNNIEGMLEDVYLGESSSKILNNIINILNGLGDMDGIKVDSIIGIVSLSIYVENNIEDLNDSISIDADNFKLSEYQGCELSFNAFAHFNTIDTLDTLAYIDLGEVEEVDFNASSHGFNNEILALFIYKLYEIDDFTKGYILHRKDVDIYQKVESAFKTLCVLKKRVIHKPKNSNTISDVTQFLNDITCTKSFNQFDESLVIISEMNERCDILGEFINIYHVIESFMNKVPLVHLANSNNGKVFKIRDFKRLYSNISKSELISITNLFKKPEIGTKYWDVSLGSDTFKDLVKSKLNCIESNPVFNVDECNSFLSNFELYENNYFTQLKNGVNEAKYATLIYKVRCALVHNTETEYHISHFNLSASDALFIDEILISPLIVLISRLLTDNESNVWYKGQDISLYG